MTRLRRHSGLIIILSAYFVLGGLYLWTTPLLETPDEASHFSVAKYMADEGRIPPQQPPPAEPEPVPIIHEGAPVYYAPPLYYALGAILIADLDTSGYAQGVIPNPNWGRGWSPTPGRSPENKHMYVHTADQRAPYAGWAQAMYRLRVFSLLLGGATVTGTYALARALWPLAGDRGWVWAATALVAFNPAFLFSTTGVTNGALLIALSTWAFVIMARLVGLRTRPTGRNGWVLTTLLGVVMGLAGLTKQSAFVFLPAAGLAVLWGASTQPRSKRTAIIWLVLLALLVALVSGWWYLHNTLAYDDPLGMRPHQIPSGSDRPSLTQTVRQLGQVLQGYWGAFGWGLILVDPVVYLFLAAFAAIGLLGWLRRPMGRTPETLTSKHPPRSNIEQRLVIILGLGVGLNSLGLAVWLLTTSLPFGSRLFFPTLAPLAVLLVMGWRRWLGSRRAQRFAWAVALAFGLYALVVPWRYLRPAYADAVVPPATVAQAVPLDAQFCVREPDEGASGPTSEPKGCIRLLGYRATPEAAHPGDRITLALYWQATEPIADDLTVFVQIAPQDPQRRIVGVDEFLGSSRYPSSVWRTDEVVQQVHQFQLPEDVPAPALYWFNVGLYGEPGSERLAVTVDESVIRDRAVRLGPLALRGQDPKEPQQRIDYRFGPAIRLTGYDVETASDGMGSETENQAPEPAASVPITLYWQADATPENDWVVFVHLLDADWQLVAQHDGSPRDGEYPTWAWQPGERVSDTHKLLLPPDLVAGTYRLQVGLYLPDDGARAPISDSAAQPVPDGVLSLTDLHWDGQGVVRGD
jgi:4-amino-4-deoxy-L-arabinose transferase-like glycosyltransferase